MTNQQYKNFYDQGWKLVNALDDLLGSNKPPKIPQAMWTDFYSLSNDLGEKLDELSSLNENNLFSKKRLMEIAGISHLYESSANNKSAVASAINKNKAALTSAIKDRLADDENIDLHDRVEKLLIKTAIEAGLPIEYVEKIPWMEGFAVPGDSSPAKDLKNLQDFLEDVLDNPEIT